MHNSPVSLIYRLLEAASLVLGFTLMAFWKIWRIVYGLFHPPADPQTSQVINNQPEPLMVRPQPLKDSQG